MLGKSSLGADLPGAAAGGQVRCSGSPLGLFLLLAPPETDSCAQKLIKKKKKKLKSQLVIKSGGGNGKRNQNRKG